MSVTGLPGKGPLRVGVPIADLTAGIFLAQGILIALLDRETTGIGAWVQTSLLQAQVAMLDGQAMRWLGEGYLPKAVGNDHPTGVPMGTFEAAGGEYINIAASSQRLFPRFCAVAGLDHLVEDPRFASVANRKRNAAALKLLVANRLRELSAAEWNDRLNAVGVPCGSVLNIQQVFEDPQVRHLKIAQSCPHPTKGEIQLLGSPIDILGASKALRNSPPNIGEHTNEIMTDLGYGPDEIANLRASGVI
jgi:formyl-CoA transferase